MCTHALISDTSQKLLEPKPTVFNYRAKYLTFRLAGKIGMQGLCLRKFTSDLLLTHISHVRGATVSHVNLLTQYTFIRASVYLSVFWFSVFHEHTNLRLNCYCQDQRQSCLSLVAEVEMLFSVNEFGIYLYHFHSSSSQTYPRT